MSRFFLLCAIMSSGLLFKSGHTLRETHITKFNVIVPELVPASKGFVLPDEPTCKKITGDSSPCVELEKCPALLSTLTFPHPTEKNFEILSQVQCGFSGKNPKVCCQESPRPPISEKKYNCLTPDNKKGTCVNVYTCPHVGNLIRTSYVALQTYILNYRCHGETLYSVCCPLPTVEPTVPHPTVCPTSAIPPDPRTECCGKESGNSNRIIGGSETYIDQYPWLVVIEYFSGTQITRGDEKLLCGGVLISGRYVLTAGHCVKGQVLEQGTPTNVRLGEYNIANSGPDCMEVEGGGMDCTSGAIIVPIEEIIPHSNFDPNNRLRRNDIALIRLSQMVPYTDFIRPICLPIKDVTVSLAPEEKLFTAGWGAIDMVTRSSDLKLHVDLPLVPFNVCEAKYNEPQLNVQLWGGQMCAGGEPGKDSCKGDSGGPLMYENRRLFEVVGVVSFGPLPCGQTNVPGVYTKVYAYLPWIWSKVKP